MKGRGEEGTTKKNVHFSKIKMMEIIIMIVIVIVIVIEM